MTWLESLTIIFFALILGGTLLVLWLLEKPQRDLNNKRIQAQYDFYHSASYVFNHIAFDIEGFDCQRLMFQDFCRTGSYFYELSAAEIEETLKKED